MKLKILLILIVIATSCSKDIDDGTTQAAIVDGELIEMSEIDALIQPEMYESLFNTYYARRKIVDELVANKLLTGRAASLGITLDSLKSSIIINNEKNGGKEKFIADNFLREGIIDPEQFGAKIPLYSEKGKRIFRQMFERDVLDKYVIELKKDSKVDVYIHPPLPPKINLSGIDYHSLNGSKKGTIWLFSDYSCTHCKDFYPTYEALLRKFESEYEFRYTTMTSEVSDVVLLGEFAATQHKMESMNSAIFSQIGSHKLNFENLTNQNGLDYTKFLEFATDSSNARKIKDNYLRLGNLGKFQVTPTVVINDRVYYGDLSLQALTSYIRESAKYR